MIPLKLAVLASGRGSNLQAIIESIEAGHVNAKINLVISNVSDAYALVRAEKHGIPTRFVNPKEFSSRLEYDSALAEIVQESQADLVVLAGYMLVLTPAFLDRFPNRVINIHPALLPSFPGVNGQKQAVDYGVKISGCTVHFVDSGVDTGPIIAQRAVPVLDYDTEETLAARILEQEHQVYPEVIRWIANGKVEVVGRKVFVKK